VTGIGIGTGTSKYTDLVTKSIQALSSGTASNADQLAGYQNLIALVYSNAPGGGSLLEQTNKNDWQRAVDALANSPGSQRIQQVEAQFNNAETTAARSSNDQNANPAQTTLNILSQFSQDDQATIFVATSQNIPGFATVGGKSISYATLSDWKASLQQQATATATANSAATATPLTTTPPATTGPVVSTTAKAAIQVKPVIADTPTTTASIALQLVLSEEKAVHNTTAKATGPTTSRASTPIASDTTATNDLALPTSIPTPADGRLDLVA